MLLPCKTQKMEKRHGLKNSLKDLPKKALFLFLVCLLWVFVIGIRQGEVGFNIPIEYYSIPQNLVIAGEPPERSERPPQGLTKTSLFSKTRPNPGPGRSVQCPQGQQPDFSL